MRTFDFPFRHSPLGLIGIVMHFVLIKMSRNSVLLINNLSKRGDMKTWARSLVSPSSQVKVKLKLITSK